MRCLKCNAEYKVDVITKKKIIRGERIEETFYRVHCKKCGHVLSIMRSKDKKDYIKSMGFDKPEEILTEEEFFRFQTQQAEGDYRFAEKLPERHAKRIREQLKKLDLTEEEENIEREKLVKEKALRNLVLRAAWKLNRARGISEEERKKLKKDIKDEIKEIRSGDYDPDDMKKEIEAISKEIDKAKAREDTIKDIEKDINRKKKKLKDELEKPEIISHGEDYFTKKLGEEDVKHSSKYKEAHWTEKKDAWINFYNQEMENLRAAYEKGDLDDNEFRKNVKDLKKHVNQKMPERGKWSWRASKMGTHHIGTQLKSVIYILAAVLIGAIVSGTTGSYLFFFGFLGVSLYLIAPDPKNIEEKKGQKIGLSSVLLFHPETRSKQNSAGFLRSFGKVTAIACFAFGFQGMGDVFNTLYIATAVIGYFLLKVEYENSPEFIESLLRFFLGMMLIPWIFNDIFDSLILAGVAFAFFAVPPLPNESNKNIGQVLSRGLSGATAYYEMAEKFIFGGIMIVVLIASGSLGSFGGLASEGWQLTGTLKYTFIYFWLVCGVAGFFSPAKERPVTGAIMLVAATVIYGIGPGSQQIGSGLLGQWWPSVNEAFASITEPMANLMGSLGKTFSHGFLLLTNPVGYATQLMNGSYADNPGGQTGSFGVDINEFTITNIFPEQPYVVTAIMENKGASDAENVRISLQAKSGDKFATEGTSRTRTGITQTRDKMTIDISKLGFGDTCDNIDNENTMQFTADCIKYYTGRQTNKLEKLMVWQAAFQSKGINCDTIVGSSMRNKYIPIMATVTYDYDSSSRVEVEFMSKAEWERLAQAGQLDSRFRFIESQYTSAPVKFPIGTAGLKNPILEDQQFHISVMLDSAFDRDSEIDDVREVSLTYPADWKLKSCTPQGTEASDSTTKTYRWKYYEEGANDKRKLSPGAKTFVCYFESLNKKPDAMGGAPSKTYVVTAHADYTFSRWKIRDTKIEFGGFCCDNNDCSDDQYCIGHACVYKEGEGSATVTRGHEKYCELMSGCGIAQGQCSSTGNNNYWCNEGLVCTHLGAEWVCCPDTNKMSTDECKTEYGKWKAGANIPPGPGDAGFCKYLSKELIYGYDIGAKCDIGWGGCTSNDECNASHESLEDYGVLVCKDVSGLSTKVCCFQRADDSKCKDAYALWLNGKRNDEIMKLFPSEQGSGTDIIG